jgi:hypothetical protein
MQTAIHVRRILAVFIDFWVLLVCIFGVAAAFKSGLGIVLFFVIDVLMTALSGRSIGRLATGVRVARIGDHSAPGIVRALARIAIVSATGWAFPFAAGGARGYGPLPERFWWDIAAGTIVVRAR